MLGSLGLIFLFGLSLSALFKQIKLPGLIGMLLAGMLLGPYCFNLLDSEILKISSSLRQMALIIILIKAGLSLDLKDLKRAGRSAVLLSFLPASFELAAYTIFAPMLLNISTLEGALMGSVMAAVSPAVVVPRMVKLMEEGYGVKEAIPQMILAGASCDDIYVIVLFSTFLQMVQGGKAEIGDFLHIPVSIVTGVLFGAFTGYLFSKFFEFAYAHNHKIRGSLKVLLILAVSFLLMSLEDLLEGHLAFSGLLAIVAMSCMIRKMMIPEVYGRLSEKFGKLWLGAEVLLFVLVGAAVNFTYMMKASLSVVALIFIALIVRSIGVAICVMKTRLTKKERLFCILAYLPKATVQAAIGSVPLSQGLVCGNIVLTVAVMGILITAPLGAIGIDSTYKKLLVKRVE